MGFKTPEDESTNYAQNTREQMVIMKKNFGVEPDMDSVVMNATEGSPPNDAKAAGAGHPKAVLICLRNSHPFQTRTLILTTPAKIGRSVARARPSRSNGIFDCKVLSRNHAIIWYEYDTGKFMIQDTKSSNGTFVNNQRLSKGGETSLPREFFSRDVVQFGVDVLENQRKGNEDSENSDESNHIVTHGCVVATVRLIHPNGKESKSGQPYSSPNPMTIPQEKICKLELIIHEAQQREERLHDKLEELQLIINKLESACQEALTNRFEETRLLSKIESLEKQTKVMNKIMSSGSGKTEKVESEIQQLLTDIEKVQNVAREIQERQHRKLLESEQKLVEAQRVASNLELEVIALREQASLTESQLQYMGTKCTAYCQKIETLKSSFHNKLEAQEAKMVELEVYRELNDLSLLDLNCREKYRLIMEESEKDVLKKDKEVQDVVLEWCKNYEQIDKIEEKDFINEDDKAEWFTEKFDILSKDMCIALEHASNLIEQLVNSVMDVGKSQKNLEKLCIKKHELEFQLEAAKMPAPENEKTEDELDGEKNELPKNSFINSSLSNEKITELENELKKQEELFCQERISHKELEAIYTKLRSQLDETIKLCKKLNSESCNLKALLKSHLKSLADEAVENRQKLAKLESEVNELENGQELKPTENIECSHKNVESEVKETQTATTVLITSSTNTEPEDVKAEITTELQTSRNLTEEPRTVLDEEDDSGKSTTVISQLPSPDNSSCKEPVVESEMSESFVRETTVSSENMKPYPCRTEESLGVWDKIQKVQRLLPDQPSGESSLSDNEFVEIKSLMNLIAEDLVQLLLRDQQMSKDKQSLQEKLDKSMSRSDSSNFGLANQFLALTLALIVYYLGAALFALF